MVSVLFEPPWLEGYVNGATQPLGNNQSVAVTVPAGGEITYRLQLTDSAVDLRDPNNEGIFGNIEFSLPTYPGAQLATAGIMQFVAGNDDFSGALLLDPVLGSVSGDNIGAGKQPGEPDHAGNAGGASVWFQYQAPANVRGQLVLTTEFSDIDTLLAVYTGDSISSLVEIAANDDQAPGSGLSSLSFAITPGENYFIALDGAARGGAAAETGFYQLNFTQDLQLANDDFRDAVELTGSQGSVTQTVLFSANPTREMGEPAHGGGLGGSTWYRWVAPASGVYRFTVGSGVSGQPVVAVYLGDTVESLIEVAANTILANAEESVDFFRPPGSSTELQRTTRGLVAAIRSSGCGSIPSR